MVYTVSLPAHNEHTHTIIYLHGHSSSAHILSQQLWETRDCRGESVQHIFPSVKWVFPQANEIFVTRLDQTMREWFDVVDIQNPDERRELQRPGLKDVVPQLVELVEYEGRIVGLENVILAGISEGCATAIQVLLNLRGQNRRLCAFIGTSGWMSLGGSSAQESRELLGLKISGSSHNVYRNTPVFICHCADDPSVPIEQGRRLRDTLITYGMTVTWKEYPTGGHWINCPQGVEDIATFLRAQGLTHNRYR
ncbi:Phospholipase/carboxylesterase [Xylaria bambusicola]|uniref:Phospholipase/carboxylesterase n=1 Tax=Xylaria bambusicola TaxID=326684 RepID=UPI00200791B6|nr:Phospholipase/carboxylesterase [Xylaria bambusicola]KAI0506510.1 Phospholipase/carboxylesterase [Xylaria bambusicola]